MAIETRKAFHEELDDVGRAVVELSAMATQSIQAGTDAFLNDDMSIVERVIEGDRAIDKLTFQIEEHVSSMLALQAPLGADLRTLVGVLRIIHELERIGDNMVNVAKATRRLHPQEVEPRMRGIIQRMREQAIKQLDTAVTSFVERDASKAAALNDMDDVMDDLEKDMFRVIFDKGNNEEAIQQSVQIALVGRYFERIADHAVNFGERVQYMVTGISPKI